MNRIDQKFQELRARKEPAFIPFITAGDPDLQVTKSLILELERQGADIIELGIPFSDPIADGPVIQASYYRALSKGLRLQDAFAMVKELRGKTEIPLLSMVSYSIVYSKGKEAFIQKAQEAGFDGATIPDLPVEESEALLRAAEKRDFCIVCFVAPTTTPSRMNQIVKKTQGFLYYISVVGITGVRNNLPEDMKENVLRLKELTNKPVALGFGVSTPEQARAVGRVADGVIVGSAIMKEIEENLGRPLPEMTRAVGDLASRLAQGAKGKV